MAHRPQVYAFLYFICSCLTKLVLAQPVGQCPVPALGPACDSQSAPWLAATAGNPVNLINGNKYLQHTDSYPLSGAPLLWLARHYNSMDNRPTVLGAGWEIHWNIRLYPQRQLVALSDGRHIPFKAHALSHETDPRGNHYRLQLAEHRELWFNHQGYLTRWHEPGRGTLDIQRYSSRHPVLAHQIQTITSNNQHLRFEYQTHPTLQTPLLHAITGPFGTLYYHHELDDSGQAARLIRVQYPDGRRLIYHYEQPQFFHALTGVSLQFAQDLPAQRMHYWWYDAQGRAFFSARQRGQQWIRIDFEPQTTTPKNTSAAARLQRQVYSAQGLSLFEFSPHQQQWRLTASQGVPCPGCPPVPMHHEHRAEGQHLSWNRTHWQHRSDGQRILALEAEPWPELQLEFGPNGELQAWQSSLTGRTEWQRHAEHQRLEINYANGDKARLYHDIQQQPQRVEFHAAASNPNEENAPVVIEFTGLGSTRIQLTHPHETQWWRISNQQIQQREVQRHLTTSQGEIRWHYREQFTYDDHGHIIEHQLPEGGSLRYDYDENQQLRQIQWDSGQGRPIPVITYLGKGLWQHHNQVYSYHRQQSNAQQKLIFTEDQLLAGHGQHEAPPQQLHWQWQATPQQSTALSVQQTLLHDRHGQLVGAQSKPSKAKASPPDFWAWDRQGQNIAHSRYDTPVQSRRDASGLIKSIQGGYLERPRTLRYNSQRRLAAVYEHEKLLARYQHDAFGYRIHAHYPQEQQHHFYLFQQQRLVAEWQGSDTDLNALTTQQQTHPITRRYLYLQDQVIAMIEYEPDGPALYAVHSNLIGAPFMVTNTQQEIVWQALYEPLGQAVVQHEQITFRLRFPGQYEDPATGWHDNVLRTYDPLLGHYLEPDPLGPVPGHQPLGYARQRPWQFIDPLGLLLFAFDGTRYDARLQSNVWQLGQAYEGSAYYQPGPGNASYVDWDALTAWSASQIIHTQWQHLLNELLWQEAGQQLVINIIGFSRGAALARHFANQILDATQGHWFSFTDEFGKQYEGCISPHFMGLFDTVAQFGLLGSNNHLYNLSIAPEWAWVAHAVALNEYRPIYPLYGIDTDAQRVQAGFIGNHGDLGGGQSYVGTATAQGDLHKIPLAWMVWQAQTLGLSFALEGLEQVQQPILHDARAPMLRYLATDRNVQEGLLSTPQRLHPEIGQAVRNEVEALIKRYGDWQIRRSHDVGTVDLADYYAWLDARYGWQPGKTAAPALEHGKEQ